MSTVGAQPQTAVSLVCGCCQHTNLPAAKFCGGCGHTLYEPCPSCAVPVGLTQHFCNDCGADLRKALQSRIDAANERVQKALVFAKEYRFDDALDAIRYLANDKDYRFAEFATLATQAREKIQLARQRIVDKVSQACASAASLDEKNQEEQIIKILEPLPDRFLNDEFRGLLARSRSSLEEKATLITTFKNAMAEHDLRSASDCIGRCIEIFPDEPRFRTFATQIAEKLKESSSKLIEERRYEDALDAILSIPEVCQDNQCNELRQSLLTTTWLLEQLNREPYATPALGRLAVRLSKHMPQDPLGKTRAGEIGAKLKEANRPKRCPYPEWQGTKKTKVGGTVSLFGWPESIGFSTVELLRKSPGRFSVAYGLALQGIGESSIEERFNPKKGFLAGLGGKKKGKAAWGIDIGNSGIKAVLLERDGEQVRATNAYLAEYPIPAVQVRDSVDPSVVKEAIEKMIAAVPFGEVPIWANLPSRDVLPRFVVLPPVDDKKAAKLLDLEITQMFPIAVDQLALIRWMAPNVDSSTGRPTAIMAARKSAVEQRLDFLKHAGLNVTGLQCDQAAIINFARREFSSLLSVDNESRMIPAFIFLDAGASCINFCVIDRDGFWFRSLDGGGMELTLALARSCKVVATDAEGLKRDPSRLAAPHEQWEAVEEKTAMLVSRLKQLVNEATKGRTNLQINETWVTGGAAFTHSWVRQVIHSFNG